MVRDTGLDRCAVWLTVTIVVLAVLDVVDAHGLATLVELTADAELPSRLAQPRFFQQLAPFRWLQWLRAFNPFAELFAESSPPAQRPVTLCSTSGVAR
jgi:hypothetical protein